MAMRPLTAALLFGLLLPLQTEAQKSTSASRLQPEAQRILTGMSDYLRTSRSFRFEVQALHDDVLPSGQKIMIASSNEVSLRRPERLYVNHRSDAGNRQLWYDGNHLSLLDPDRQTFAQESFSGNTDKALEHLMKVLHFSPPLADFLFENPATALLKHTLHGFVVGQTQVDDHPAIQLAFVDRYVDWQIWIQTSPVPIPLRLVITYKTIQGSPQYVAHFTHWDFTTRLPDTLFQPVLPQGSRAIPFMKTEGPGTRAPLQRSLP